MLFSITVKDISFTIIYINIILIWIKVIGKKINKIKSKLTEIVFKLGIKNFVKGFLYRIIFRAYIVKVYGCLTNFWLKFKEKV